MIGGLNDEAHQDGQQTIHAEDPENWWLRRMPGILPVCVQDFLHGRQSGLRKVSDWLILRAFPQGGPFVFAKVRSCNESEDS